MLTQLNHINKMTKIHLDPQDGLIIILKANKINLMIRNKVYRHKNK